MEAGGRNALEWESWQRGATTWPVATLHSCRRTPNLAALTFRITVFACILSRFQNRTHRTYLAHRKLDISDLHDVFGDAADSVMISFSVWFSVAICRNL